MIAKIVLLFLAVMAVLGLFGKWRMPGKPQLDRLRKAARLDASKCADCGSYRIGKGPCNCGKGKR